MRYHPVEPVLCGLPPLAVLLTRALLEQPDCGVIVIASDAVVLRANDAAARAIGAPGPDLESRTLEALLGPVPAAAWRHGVSDAFASGLPQARGLPIGDSVVHATVVPVMVPGMNAPAALALWSGPPRRPSKAGFSLTDSERQIVCLLGEGLSNTEIATRIRRSRRTVEGHVHTLLKKLRRANLPGRGRTDLVRLALTHGLSPASWPLADVKPRRAPGASRRRATPAPPAYPESRAAHAPPIAEIPGAPDLSDCATPG